MFLGRAVGWLLMGLAFIMASGDAVMALGPADYVGIITADVVTLLAGHAPEAEAGASLLETLMALVLDMPAWIVVGLTGLGLTFASRRRARRLSFRR